MKRNLITLFLLSILFTFQLFSEFTPKKVGILIYDGVYLLDFCGPLEIFNDTFINDSTKGFNVKLVAPSKKIIKAHTGTEIIPDCSIADCQDFDIIVVPGGNLNLSKENREISEYLKKISKSAEYTMSVCTGAFIIADLGILNGMEATTWYGAASRLQKKYPEIKVINEKRFTDNGKIITTAGVSAGVDGALHLVEKIYGKEIAQKTAKYIEWEF